MLTALRNEGKQTSQSLLNQFRKSHGKKTAADYAEILRGNLERLLAEKPIQALLLYTRFKQYPTSSGDSFDKVTKESVSKALKAVGEKTPIIENYEADSLIVKNIMASLNGITDKVSWDAIAIVYKKEFAGLREAVCTTLIPVEQAIMYSRAYFHSATIKEAEEELVARFKLCEYSFVWINKIFQMSANKPLSPEGVIDYAQSWSPSKAMILPLDAKYEKYELSKFTDEEVRLDPSAFLRASFLIDAKYLIQASDFKQGTTEVKKDWLVIMYTYAYAICGLAKDSFNMVDPVLGSFGVSGEKPTEFQKYYYASLRALRIILRKVKSHCFGGKTGNPRSNTLIVNEVDSTVLDDAISRTASKYGIRSLQGITPKVAALGTGVQLTIKTSDEGRPKGE